MKKYTQADFDNFEVDEYGRKICPTGDYTAIKSFGERCRFGEVCHFGKRGSFGEWCYFGAGCRFGERCRFGAWCIFGEGCRFGELCSFGEECRFGEECSFGEWCSFGEGGTFCEGSNFGDWCTFGECCNFGEGCNYENGKVKNGHYVAVDRIDNTNRKVYFYIDENGNMFVRIGCWFSGMQAFKNRVKEVHAGTIHKKTYLAACDLAELMLKGGNNTE